MLNNTSENDTVLTYPNFIEVLQTMLPLMLFRVLGGLLYLGGWLLMCYNIWQTLRGAKPVTTTIEVPAESPLQAERHTGITTTFVNPPFIFSTLGSLFAFAWMFGNDFVSLAGLIGTMITAVLAVAHFQLRGSKWGDWYDRLLESAAPFTILTFIAAAAGGAIQIIPTLILHTKTSNIEDRKQVPYTPLELAGREIYVRDGCYTCHSQMIRTMVPDVMRYGDYSRLGESIYDHPFQWGSKRTGPDLARVGSKYNHAWHFKHMRNPRDTSPGSNMPNFPWLYDTNTDLDSLPSKIYALRTLGTPYPSWSGEEIAASARAQAKTITTELKEQGEFADPDTEIIALIAYLQKLGKSEIIDATK